MLTMPISSSCRDTAPASLYPWLSAKEIQQEGKIASRLRVQTRVADSLLLPAIALTAPLEELHSAFVFLGAFQCVESPEIPSPARLRIDFSRIQTVHAGLKFSNYDIFSFINISACASTAWLPLTLPCQARSWS